jgi:hypothetical protein
MSKVFFQGLRFEVSNLKPRTKTMETTQKKHFRNNTAKKNADPKKTESGPVQILAWR